MAGQDETQISAYISAETKEALERYTRKTGVRKQHVVHQALQHYLQAVNELPADVIVHPRLVVSEASGKKITEALHATKSKPTKALRALMSRDDD